MVKRGVVRHLKKTGSESINQKPGKIVTGEYLSDMEQQGAPQSYTASATQPPRPYI